MCSVPARNRTEPNIRLHDILATLEIMRRGVGEVESGSGSLSESGSKGRGMGFGHEKLDVCRAAIESFIWAYRCCESLKGNRNAKDPLLRASQAIPLRSIPIPIPTPTPMAWRR